MDQPADFAPGARGQPEIGLAQFDAVLFGQLVQPFDRAKQQMAIRGMRNRFGLRRRVDGDALHLGFIDRLRPRRGGQRFGQQEFELVSPNAPSPNRHRRAIERQPGLKIRLAAEDLEIGIFDPLRADLIVRDAARVLEQMQPDHQPCRQARASLLGVEGSKRFVEAVPLDQPRQSNQLVAHVDHVIETVAEHVRLAGGRGRNGLGSHRSLLRWRVNHGPRQQGIAERRPETKTPAFSSIASETLQIRIRCYAKNARNSRRISVFRGRLA